MSQRRTVMTMLLVFVACRDRSCADAATADGDGDGGMDTDGDDTEGPDAQTCGGAIELAIVADDSSRELRLDRPAAFDVRAIYETGHFGVLEDAEFSAEPSTRIRVDEDGVLVPLAAGPATITVHACGMETSIDVVVYDGTTPYQQIVCDAWRAAIEAVDEEHEPCFTETLPEPECSEEEADHDAAFEALATCVGAGEPSCDDEQAELDERFATLATCLETLTIGDVDCAPTLAFTREQCSTYAQSDCAGLETPAKC